MKTLRKILGPVGVVWFIALLIAGFLAYFVTILPALFGARGALGPKPKS